MIYSELRDKSYSRINKVVVRGLLIAVSAYIVTGVFGSTTFINNPNGLKSENILDAPYQGNKGISVALISQYFSILTSAPLTLLPCKDTIEQLWGGKTRKMSGLANFFVTLGLITVAYSLSILLTSIGDALTIVGSTITPTIGFLIPIVFYLKVHDDKPIFWSKKKLVPIIVGVIVVVISIINLANFYINKQD